MFRKHLAARRLAEQKITDAIRQFESATGHSIDEIELDVSMKTESTTLWRVHILEGPMAGPKHWQDPADDQAPPGAANSDTAAPGS
jgi:hypothetical protein